MVESLTIQPAGLAVGTLCDHRRALIEEVGGRPMLGFTSRFDQTLLIVWWLSPFAVILADLPVGLVTLGIVVFSTWMLWSQDRDSRRYHRAGRGGA